MAYNHHTYISNDSGKVEFFGSNNKLILVFNNANHDELIEAVCKNGKSYAQIIKCPNCDNIQIYYFKSLFKDEDDEGRYCCDSCNTDDTIWGSQGIISLEEAKK